MIDSRQNHCKGMRSSKEILFQESHCEENVWFHNRSIYILYNNSPINMSFLCCKHHQENKSPIPIK